MDLESVFLYAVPLDSKMAVLRSTVGVVTVEGIISATLQRFLISFKTLWFGALFGRSFPRGTAVFAAIYS